jgi:hypothetical protein
MLTSVLRGVRPCDWALLAFLLLATLWGIAMVSDGAAASDEVVIEVDNKPLYRFPLSVDRTIETGGLTVEIKDRRVRVLTAECPNKLCVKQGWIEHGAIICLPLKTVITIKKRRGATPGDKGGVAPGGKGSATPGDKGGAAPHKRISPPPDKGTSPPGDKGVMDAITG